MYYFLNNNINNVGKVNKIIKKNNKIIIQLVMYIFLVFKNLRIFLIFNKIL